MAEKKRQEDEVCTTGIIVSAGQIEADVLSIIDGAIVSPRYPLRARKATHYAVPRKNTKYSPTMWTIVNSGFRSDWMAVHQR